MIRISYTAARYILPGLQDCSGDIHLMCGKLGDKDLHETCRALENAGYTVSASTDANGVVWLLVK